MLDLSDIFYINPGKKNDQSLQSELRERKQCSKGISPIAIKGCPKGYIMEQIMTKTEKFFSVKLIKCLPCACGDHDNGDHYKQQGGNESRESDSDSDTSDVVKYYQ